MLEQMVHDFCIFLEYYTLVAFAFSIALVGLGRAGMHEYTSDHYLSQDGAFSPVLWATFGVLEPHRYTDQTSMVLILAYLFFANVSLINLLIAMYATTYQRVKEATEKEYSYKRYLTLHMYTHVMHPLPPPINAPILLWQVSTK